MQKKYMAVFGVVLQKSYAHTNDFPAFHEAQ